jgi:outer membrane protein OmpU
MNKLKKIGLSALAGSLAMTTANAVDYVVAGDAAMNYTGESANSSTGNGDAFNIDSSLYFDASGSLDNGWNVSFSMDWDNESGTVSNTSTQAAVTMGSMGTIQINQIGGSAGNSIDDVTPSAYEEAYGMGGLADGTGHNVGGDAGFFGSSTNSGSIQYTAPALESAGATITASIGFDPAANTDGASFNGTQPGESGMFYVLKVAHESGLEIGAGLEEVESDKNTGTAAGRESKDEESVTAYAKYSMGPVSVGIQESYQDSLDGKADYEANMWSIAYTAGDVSVSYGETETITKALAATAERTTDADAIAVSYSMGSMTIQAQRSEQSRSVAGTAGSTDLDETGIKVSFAF